VTLNHLLYACSYWRFVLSSLYLQKKGITQKKADIEFIITNRVNRLFKQAIQRFKEDVKLWMSYIKFCKQMVSVCRYICGYSQKTVWRFKSLGILCCVDCVCSSVFSDPCGPAVGLSDHEVAALWSFKILGASYLLTQCNISKDLNILLFCFLLFTVFSLLLIHGTWFTYAVEN